MSVEKKTAILQEFERIYPIDLSIVEISQKVGLTHYTTSMYLKILEAEKKIEPTRIVGKAKFYRLNKKDSKERTI
jgi:predicted transcriptional regulator